MLKKNYQKLKESFIRAKKSIEAASESGKRNLVELNNAWVSERENYCVPVFQIDVIVDSLSQYIYQLKSDLVRNNSYSGPSPDGGKSQEILKAKIDLVLDIKKKLEQIVPKRSLEE